MSARPALRPKLVALDLDGTLLSSGNELRETVVEAVLRASASGVVVTIVTGRIFAGTAPFARRLGITAPVVCYQGAALFDPQSGAILTETPLANATALRVYDALRPLGYHVQMYAGDRFYCEERNRFSELYARLAGVEPIVVPSLRETFAGRDTTKLNVVTDIARTPACYELAREVCGADAYVTRSNPEFVEVMSPLVSKGVALGAVAARLGIPLDRVLAVGDSFNDLPLLAAAGFSVAMGSAPQALVAAADAVVADWAHDGVKEAIERFVLEIPAERSA
jgi:Cof subfamily protein (haloacid dehalogenase superfamily)